MNLDLTELRKNFEKPYTLIKTTDNQTLFLREWKSEAPTDVAILIFHGITAYSEPYSEISSVLKSEGYNVFGLDLRGHGRSDGNRGDMPSRERLIKDLCETIDFIKKNYPKLILFGHSLGVVSTLFALDNCGQKVDGLILLSAARQVKEGVYPKQSIFTKLKILYNYLFHKDKPIIEYKREGMQGLDDPLFNFKYTLRFLRIFSPKDVEIPDKIEKPIIVGVGDHDELFAIDAVKELYDELPSKNKDFFIIKGAKHAEFPKGSFTELIKWLGSHFPIQ
jgi:alpha-beta hydrolase superfamily lysophospholipase